MDDCSDSKLTPNLRAGRGVGLLLLILCGCSYAYPQSVQQMGLRKLDGIYEFVSQTSRFTEPVAESESRSSDDWTGIWIFYQGYFSRTVVKKKKSAEAFVPPLSEVGDYQSATGRYVIDNGYVTMTYPLAQGSSFLRPELMQYRLKGSLLTLIETFTPNLHGNSKGSVVTILRRVKKQSVRKRG